MFPFHHDADPSSPVVAIRVVTGFKAIAEQAGKDVVGPGFEATHEGIDDVVE